MAVFQGSVYSAAMDMETSLAVILPKPKTGAPFSKPEKVLYLLHGLSDNFTRWLYSTDIEAFATNLGCAVVMPDAGRGFYCDMVYGLRYFTYIATELPEMCKGMFNLPRERENTFIAGLSMGGYGALKCALTYPEQYAGGASFSGAIDLSDVIRLIYDMSPAVRDQAKGILGTELAITPENDLYQLAESALKKNLPLKLYQSCGFSDFLYQTNLKFRDFMQQRQNGCIDYRYEEWEGDHTWEFWQASLHKALAFFFGV